MSATALTVADLHTNQIVKGARCGTFVVLALRQVGGEWCADVKEVHPVTHAPARGQMTMPLSALRLAAQADA